VNQADVEATQALEGSVNQADVEATQALEGSVNQADVEATFAVSRAVTVSDDALIRQSSSLGSLGDETRAAPKSISDTSGPPTSRPSPPRPPYWTAS